MKRKLQSMVRSKWFWAALVGKFLVTAIVVSYIIPQATEAATIKSAAVCPVGKAWTFQAKSGLSFPVTFTIPAGWSVRWQNRPGTCVGAACVVSTVELNPGYLYDADHVALRQGSALKLVWIDKGSFGAGGDEVVNALKTNITYVKHKTWVNPGQMLVTREEGILPVMSGEVPTQDYTVLLNDERGMLFLSLEEVTKENTQAAEALVKSLRKTAVAQ